MENKIKSLGGTKTNPMCASDSRQPRLSADFQALETKMSANIPQAYKRFYNNYGACSFNKRVKCANEENDTWLHVDYFYSIDPESKCSVYIPLTDHPELLERNLFPVCDAEAGDLICISLDAENYGGVYNWYHEKEEGENCLLIAVDFERFIMKLEIDPEEDIDEEAMAKIVIKASPELLEMLRKDGYRPKP